MKSSVSESKTLQSRFKGEILGQARRKERLSRSKLKQALLIDSDAELFLYLSQCIRFGSWKVRRLNRALQTHHSCCLRLSLFYAWSAFFFIISNDLMHVMWFYRISLPHRFSGAAPCPKYSQFHITYHSYCLRFSLFYAWSAFKFQRTAVSTGFVQKCLWNLCTLIFAKVNGNFASDTHRYAAVKSILRANLQEHNLKRRPNDSILK